MKSALPLAIASALALAACGASEAPAADPAPAPMETVAAEPMPAEPVAPANPSVESATSAPRIAAPRTGPAAMPRKVRAPMTPSARGREAPVNRWEAATTGLPCGNT